MIHQLTRSMKETPRALSRSTGLGHGTRRSSYAESLALVAAKCCVNVHHPLLQFWEFIYPQTRSNMRREHAGCACRVVNSAGGLDVIKIVNYK